jgi:polysaccharide export outer membrane protein
MGAKAPGSGDSQNALLAPTIACQDVPEGTRALHRIRSTNRNQSMKNLRHLMLSALLVAASGSALSQAVAAYKLRHGDALTVSVWRDEALRMEVRVLPDGSITFPLAGRVEVAGLSTQEAESRVAEKLKKYIPEAVVSIAITATDGNRVYVLGKVVNPGPITLTSPETTVLQMLSQAGGLDRFADGNSIRVLRSSPQGNKVLLVRYDDLVKGNQLDTNVVLMPGDTILVP